MFFKMSDKKVLYELFNTKADEFFKDLCTAFPDIAQFRQFKTSLMMMKNLDVKKPQEFFNTYIACDYRTQIMSKDESFFLTNNIDVSSSGRAEYWMEFIANLRQIWKDLDDNNKSIMVCSIANLIGWWNMIDTRAQRRERQTRQKQQSRVKHVMVRIF